MPNGWQVKCDIMNNLSKGQKLWLSNKNGIREVEVSTVGRKYFTLTDSPKDKYFIDTLKLDTQYHTYNRIWFSKQEYDDSVEKSELYLSIRKSFDGFSDSKFTLSQLREINKILTK